MKHHHHALTLYKKYKIISFWEVTYLCKSKVYCRLFQNSNQYARRYVKKCDKTENKRNLNGINFSVILKRNLTKPQI